MAHQTLRSIGRPGTVNVVYSGASGGESRSSSRSRLMRFCRERDGRGGSPSICRNLSPTSAVIARVCIGSSSSRSFCIVVNSQLRKSFEAGQRRGSEGGSVSQHLSHATVARRLRRRRSIRQIHLQTCNWAKGTKAEHAVAHHRPRSQILRSLPRWNPPPMKSPLAAATGAMP